MFLSRFFRIVLRPFLLDDDGGYPRAGTYGWTGGFKGARQNMRVYHFLNKQYGLKDLRERRLKVAQLEEINDPFEVLPACADADVRSRFRAFRRDVSKTVGVMCYSKSWTDPVQWSHYADRHHGLCLGFDIPDEVLFEVRYRRQRLKADFPALTGTKEESQAELKRWFTTKFVHWKYEQEVRAFLILTNMVPEEGLYYVDFDEATQLREVIVGDSSDLTRADINEALGDLAPTVEVFKARLAFRSYRVVRQRRADIWT